MNKEIEIRSIKTLYELLQHITNKTLYDQNILFLLEKKDLELLGGCSNIDFLKEIYDKINPIMQDQKNSIPNQYKQINTLISKEINETRQRIILPFAVPVFDHHRPDPEAVIGNQVVDSIRQEFLDVVLLILALVLAIRHQLQGFIAPKFGSLGLFLVEMDFQRWEITYAKPPGDATRCDFNIDGLLLPAGVRIGQFGGIECVVFDVLLDTAPRTRQCHLHFTAVFKQFRWLFFLGRRRKWQGQQEANKDNGQCYTWFATHQEWSHLYMCCDRSHYRPLFSVMRPVIRR